MSDRQRIAEDLLGVSLAPGGFAPCPGMEKHSSKSGPQDFRVVLDGAPTGFCFHTKCSDDVAAFNKELRRRVWFAERGGEPARVGHWAHGVSAAPQAEVKARPELDRGAVAEYLRGVPEVSEEYLARRSPLDVSGVTPGDFLSALYGDGERILVFVNEHSQGDFLWWVGRGGYRLSQTQGVTAAPSVLPAGGERGIWFLTQPVTGQWAINSNSVKGGGEAKWSRRSESNVTAWRYYVLESDELEASEWLRVVAALTLPISAIYTSGRRSVHALVRCQVESKAMWDACRNGLRQIVCKLGADPAALTAVRLSRLPGCSRAGQMQRLLYLDPLPDYEPIWTKEVRR